jgi:hypothetical protein
VLTENGGDSLSIPVNAENAEALFDLFGSLRNIQTTTLLDALSQTPDVRVTVWEKTPDLLH